MKTAYIANPDTPAGAAIASELAARGWNILLPEPPADGEQSVRLEAERLEGRDIDALICCPRAHAAMSAEGGGERDFDYIMEQNAKLPFFLTKHIGGLMAARKRGKIIYVGSIHAEKPTGSSFAFSCSMSALKMLCREAALQLGRDNVSCVYLECGPVEGDGALFDGPLARLYDDMDMQFPGRRPCTWEQAARTVAMLAGEDMSSLNGAEIRADGGFTLTYLDR